MPPNSFVLNQTCIFPLSANTLDSWERVKQTKKLLCFCCWTLKRFLSCLSRILPNISSLTQLCALLDRLCECVPPPPQFLPCLPVFELLYVCLFTLSSFFFSYRWERELEKKKKKRQRWDFTWEDCGPRTLSCHDAISPPRCHFRAYSSLPAEPH